MRNIKDEVQIEEPFTWPESVRFYLSCRSGPDLCRGSGVLGSDPYLSASEIFSVPASAAKVYAKFY